MNKQVFLILIALFLTGCNGFSNGTIGNPQGKVIVDGEQYIMMPGDLEWKEDNVIIRSKSSSNLNELAEQFETLEVGQGEPLKIDKNPTSITVTKLNDDGTTDLIPD